MVESLQGSDTEYSQASSDEGGGRLAKPVFVTKAARETIIEKEKAALEELAAKEEDKKRAAARVVSCCLLSSVLSLVQPCFPPYFEGRFSGSILLDWVYTTLTCGTKDGQLPEK
jgi:hypothetical protein